MPYEPAAYGAQPPNPYAAQPSPHGYGAYGPPQQGVPQAPGGLVPYGQPEPMVSRPPGIGGPFRAGALTPWLVPVAVIVGGVIVSVILSIVGHPALGLVVALLSLGGGIWTLVQVLKSRPLQ